MNCIITTGVAVRADANGSETFPERTRARKLSALSCLHSLLIEKKYSGIRGRALIASKAIVSLPASFSTLPSVDCSVYYSTDLFAPVETHVDYLLLEAFVDRSICFGDSSPFKEREREREELYLFRSVKKVEEEEMRSKRYLNEIVKIKRYLMMTILFEFAISFDDIEMGFLSSSLQRKLEKLICTLSYYLRNFFSR